MLSAGAFVVGGFWAAMFFRLPDPYPFAGGSLKACQASGRRAIHRATHRQTAEVPAPTYQRCGNWKNSQLQESVIIDQARYFARRGTARRCSQFCTIGPKKRCWCSQR